MRCRQSASSIINQSTHHTSHCRSDWFLLPERVRGYQGRVPGSRLLLEGSSLWRPLCDDQPRYVDRYVHLSNHLSNYPHICSTSIYLIYYIISACLSVCLPDCRLLLPERGGSGQRRSGGGATVRTGRYVKIVCADRVFRADNCDCGLIQTRMY